jgi:uncharacterized protein
MSFTYAYVREAKKMLENLDAWLVKAAAHAEAKKFDKEIFMQARLAPDAYPLLKQVQAACDGGKLLAARLSGKEAPVHADDEKTFDEARERIKKVTAFIDTLTAKDFEGAENKTIVLPFLPAGQNGMKATDYAFEFSGPNFFFHIVTAYQILRHNGVVLGKLDFVGSLTTIAV